MRCRCSTPASTRRGRRRARGAALRNPDDGRRDRAAHRLRQHRQPAARARNEAPPGDRAPAGARRGPIAPGAAAAHRERAPVDRRRRTGAAPRLLAARPPRGRRTGSAPPRRRRAVDRSASPAVHDDARDRDGRAVRPGPGHPGIEAGRRAGAEERDRSDGGRTRRQADSSRSVRCSSSRRSRSRSSRSSRPRLFLRSLHAIGADRHRLRDERRARHELQSRARGLHAERAARSSTTRSSTRIAGLPGVRRAAVAQNAPLGGGLLRSVFPEGQDTTTRDRILVQVNSVGVGLLRDHRHPAPQRPRLRANRRRQTLRWSS